MELTTQDAYEDDEALTEFLGRQLRMGRLSLVLGTGVSKAFKVPDWKTLLKRMYRAKRASRDPSISLTLQAESFREQFFNTDNEGFKKAVHDALYSGVNVDFSNLQQLRTLAAIGAMVMTSRRGGAAQVITFNYDNLLELYLQYHGFVVHSVSSGVALASTADVTIYHPHGYLPHNDATKSSETIILDQESYSEIVGDPSLPWYHVIHTILRSHTCLFIGLSGQDPNLDQFLVRVGKIHPSKNLGNLYWGVTFTTPEAASAAPIWRRRGVFSKTVEKYDPDLPNFLFQLCQRAASPSK